MSRRRFSRKLNKQVCFLALQSGNTWNLKLKFQVSSISGLLLQKNTPKFVRSFFWRIYGAPICFWFYLTFINNIYLQKLQIENIQKWRPTFFGLFLTNLPTYLFLFFLPLTSYILRSFFCLKIGCHLWMIVATSWNLFILIMAGFFWCVFLDLSMLSMNV